MNYEEFKKHIIELNIIIENGINESRKIDVSDTNKAHINLQSMALITTDDYFLFYASINLLNAYIKKDYATFKNYDFKKYVPKGIETLLENSNEDIKFSYNKQLTIVDIIGIQFSFHHSEITDKMKEFSFPNLEWNGIRLQPVAKEIFDYALTLSNLSKKDMFGRKIEELYILNKDI